MEINSAHTMSTKQYSADQPPNNEIPTPPTFVRMVGGTALVECYACLMGHLRGASLQDAIALNEVVCVDRECCK